ncbi:MAG: GH3 auxin-responsive promoter family protein [Chitinophagales bacterium]|nr:GH3 auxin-responsive promoter family protein [Chitinophagales bacterium]
MFVFSPIVQWFLRQRISQIEAWREYPLDAQQKVFQYLVQQAKDTEWGKTYDFASIRYADDFRNRIPLQDYESLKPYIQRIMDGEQNILWNTPVKWFSKSSGTTSDKSKFIPMTAESIEDCHYRGAIDLLSAYCSSNPDTKLFTGKGLIVGGSHQINPLNKNSLFGDLSAVLLQNMSFFAQWYRTPDLSIALMDDWEKKLEALATATIHEDVTNISGVPTWTMLLIKRLFEIKGKDNLTDIWPNLELYIHGGVSFKPYREEFKSLIRSDKIFYYETYNASEGFFGFQYGLNDDDLLLHLNNGIFYEFIPSSEFGKDKPETVFLHEVIPEENYAIVISTNGGLWRYVVGDTIRFTSVRPYKIQVTGRLKHYINAFGEEVIVENTDKALEEACRQTGAVVNDYTVAPIYLTTQHRGRHEWLIEFSKPPLDLNEFTMILDKCLRALNSDYDAKRSHDLALLHPAIIILPPYTFYNWLKSKGKLGGQNKVPRLSNDRTYADEILESCKHSSTGQH